MIPDRLVVRLLACARATISLGSENTKLNHVNKGVNNTTLASLAPFTMPPKQLKQVKADSTDPATLRPDIPPEIITGSRFQPMKCPDFPPQINLPPHVQPIDAWGIFKLFFTEEQVQIVVDNTNDHQNRPYDVLKPHSRAHQWKPITLSEAYAYLGIRIYMGIHPENQIAHYWREGPSYPSHPIKDVMSLMRFEAIHGALRLCTDDPDVEFEGVFDRVFIIPFSYI